MQIDQQQLEASAVEITDREKFVSFTKWMDVILKEQREQTKKLSSINTILVIFLIFMIISILFTACSALGIG